VVLSGFGRFPKSYTTKLQGQIYLGDKAFVAHMQSALAKDEVLQEIPHMPFMPLILAWHWLIFPVIVR
jgi:hypothetical protein